MNESDITIISKGRYCDTLTDKSGETCSFMIETFVLRLSASLKREWERGNAPQTYSEMKENEDRYLEYLAEKERVKEECEAKIKEFLCLDKDEHVTITQNVAAIFTVVKIRQIGDEA